MLMIVFGRVLQLLLLFATIKISTTLLLPAEMAKVFLVSSIVSFYAMLLINPVGMFINRHLHEWNAQGKVQHYFNYFLLYLLVVCGIAVASLYVLVEFGWVVVHTTAVWAVLLVGGSLLFTTINQAFIPGLNLLGYRGLFVALTLATSATSLVVAIVFVIGSAPKAEYWMSGLLAGQLIFALMGWNIFSRKLNVSDTLQKPTKQHISVLIGFAWPISIAVGLGWVQTQSYRFMMESGLGLHALGLFVAGYGVSSGLIAAFESVFTTYLQPMFYKNISSGNVIVQSKAWSEYAGAIIPSLILVGLVIFATAPELTRVMLGPEYLSSYQFIRWGVIAEIARVISGVYGMVAHARMKTRLLLAPSLVGAFWSIALIWWLMPIYGSNGVGVALMLSSVIACVLICISTRTEFVSNLNFGAIVKSICMGIGLILSAEILRLIMGSSVSFVTNLVQLVLVGVIFLFFQYELLRPLLHGNKI